MNIGILIPGFGENELDPALPVYQNLVRQIAKSHDVRVIALRYPHTRDLYSFYGARVYPLGYGAWTRKLRRFRLWWDAFQLIQDLHREQAFDILHGIWADETGLLSGWIGKHLNIPSVVTVAGGELVGFRDIGYGLQLGQFSRWIVRKALKHNSAIVMPCDLGDLLDGTKYSIPETNIFHIPLGINPYIFYPSDIPRKPNHLIHVGSLIPIKQQKLLLDAVALIDGVTLDIIGEGILQAELQDYTQKMRIADRVRFLGKVPHDELRMHYSEAQLHILTSRHEAFGMVVLEAAGCGTPTFGTSVGILKDEPAFGECFSDARSLSQGIRANLSGRHLENLGQVASETALSKYSIEAVAEQYCSLYQQLISGSV